MKDVVFKPEYQASMVRLGSVIVYKRTKYTIIGTEDQICLMNTVSKIVLTQSIMRVESSDWLTKKEAEKLVRLAFKVTLDDVEFTE